MYFEFQFLPLKWFNKIRNEPVMDEQISCLLYYKSYEAMIFWTNI